MSMIAGTGQPPAISPRWDEPPQPLRMFVTDPFPHPRDTTGKVFYVLCRFEGPRNTANCKHAGAMVRQRCRSQWDWSDIAGYDFESEHAFTVCILTARRKA